MPSQNKVVADQNDKNLSTNTGGKVRDLFKFFNQTGIPLLTNANFLAYCILCASLIGIYASDIVYTSGLAKEVANLSDTEIAVAISAGAICHIFGRIANGIITDLKIVQKHRVCFFIMSGLAFASLFACLQ